MLSLVVVVMFGFSAVILGNYWLSKASIRSAIIDNELPLTSDTLYSEIQRDLLKPVFVSSLMAQDTFVRDWVLAGEKDPQRMVRYLQEIQERYGAFTSFFVSESSFTYYQAKGVLKKIKRGEDRDAWFFRVRSMKQPYEINVDPDMANNDTITIFINYKVFDYKGQFIGATGIGLKADTVKRLIERYQAQYDRTVYFVSPEGQLSLYGRNFDGSETDIRKRPGLKTVADDLLGQQQGSYTYSANGYEVFANSRFIPELGWYLVVEQSGDTAFLSIEAALIRNALIGLLVTIVVTVLSALMVRNSQRRLQTMAVTDALTGVLGRLAFDVVFQQAKQRMQRNAKPISIVFFDVDHFKAINDTHGHIVGDQVLRHVCETIRRSVRSADGLCRWGGEELLLLLEDCDVTEAYDVAEKARKSMVQKPIQLENGQELTVTVSVGVAELKIGETQDQVIARADAAMYCAKDKGRNCTFVCS